MKRARKMLQTLAITLILFVMLGQKSHAVVIIYFEQKGGDVIATTTGSIIVPNTYDLTFSGNFAQANANSLLLTTSDTDRYRFGTSLGIGPTVNPSSTSGTSFGFDQDALFVPATTAARSFFTPDTQWTWFSTDLASIGLGALTSDPTTAYTTPFGEDVIRFAVVPEPSSAMLLSIASFFILGARRRNR